jgi:hypothetical protein
MLLALEGVRFVEVNVVSERGERFEQPAIIGRRAVPVRRHEA